MKMTPRHYWVVFVASLGQLVGTAVATLAGIIIPMINILRHPELSSFMQGLIGAADLIGIVFGSVVFGRLSDRYGYLFFFRFCPALILLGAVLAILFPNVTMLVVALFIIGFGIGGEYSLDSDYISELMPASRSSLMIGVGKAGSAFGNIIVAGVCYLLLSDWKNAAYWPRLMWIIAIIAGVMILCRLKFYESPKWLLDHGRLADAQRAAEGFFGPDARINPAAASPAPSPVKTPRLHHRVGVLSFLRQNGKRIILSGIPWACEGLGVYGIGVFLPILVLALGLEHIPAGAPQIMHVISSVEVTFWISCLILPGFVLGLILINKNKSITAIQSWGFWLCAVSMAILALAFHYKWPAWISIVSFMAFELFLNMGPHLITYVLPARIYPVEDRGEGTGIAASIGKIGAVLGVFCIPMLLKAGGAMLVLIVSIAVMALGAVITQLYSPLVKNS